MLSLFRCRLCMAAACSQRRRVGQQAEVARGRKVTWYVTSDYNVPYLIPAVCCLAAEPARTEGENQEPIEEVVGRAVAVQQAKFGLLVAAVAALTVRFWDLPLLHVPPSCTCASATCRLCCS